MVLNETAVKTLGLMDPIGKQIFSSDFHPDNQDEAFTVVGVVKDFHFQSLHKNIEPLFEYNLRRNITPDKGKGHIHHTLEQTYFTILFGAGH